MPIIFRRKGIFADRNDNEKFLSYISLMHNRYKVILYSYVLMDNHYHLLLETPEPNLSRMMRDLNGYYTIYFNKALSLYLKAGRLLRTL